ncbi:MAG: Maf family protein [Puniceicoccales bacterium]
MILASASPRRSDLLAEAGVAFRVEPAQVEEHEDPVGDPAFIVQHNAVLKASEVASRFPGEVVLGADTVVALGAQVLGKPKDKDEAFAMLRALAGAEHQVHTGVCLVRRNGQQDVFSVSTRVKFRELSDEEIFAYIRDVPVMDKAGSYALQDQGSRIVESVEGSRSNVIGLPVEEVLEKLRG